MWFLVNEYEKSFRKNNDAILNNFNKISLESSQDSLIDQKNKVNKAFLLEESDKLIEEQKKILKQMEIEISSLMNKDYYKEFSVKLSSFKKNLDLNKKQLNELYSKEELKNSSFMSESNLLTEKNSILLNQEKYRFQQNEKLQQVRRSLSSTEEMGSNIIVNMDNQIESMKNVTGKLKKMGKNLNESNKILNKMKSRNKKNKKLIYIFIMLFALVLIGILTIKLYIRFKWILKIPLFYFILFFLYTKFLFNLTCIFQ